VIEIKGDEVGRACSTYMRENFYIEGVRSEGKLVGNRPLRRSWRRWEGNVKMDAKGKL
jgi:hypothetical protein